jgi:hypothetical protein
MKVLKVCAIIYAIALVVVGFLNILMPEQQGKLLGFATLSNSGIFLAMMLGAAYAAIGIWTFAAVRSFDKSLTWLKFLITKALLSDVTVLYAVIRGYATFSDTWWVMAIDIVFVALFLIFYPWRSSQLQAVAAK